MANYYGQGRTNYFKVKDVAAFKRALEGVQARVHEQDGRVSVLAEDANGGGWPTSQWFDSADDWLDIDWQELIAPHLEDGEVCVMQEVGSEKLRYLVGWSLAFNNKGEAVSVNIDDIYEKAQDLGDRITQVAY